MDNQLIFRQNPWWQRVESIDEDPRLVSLRELPLVWHPDLLSQIDLDKDAVHVVSGPRQVGKSTAVRLLIRHLLIEQKTPPRNIFLFDCDILDSARELTQTVLSFLDHITGKGRKYIFLDEISAVEKWPSGIKWLIDHGKGKDCSYVLTGSSSIKLKKSGELMPARRGAGRDISFNPLTFGQFLRLLDCKIPAVDVETMSFAEITRLHNQLLLDIPDIEQLFKKYCLHGGFLRPINELRQHGFISPDTVEIYLSWIRGEIVKDNKREHVGRTVLEKIQTSLGSGISYQSLAEHMDVGSHNTARAYLDFFIDSFVLHEVPFIEISQRRIAWRKNRKYYFSDPFLFWISQLWTGGGDNVLAVFDEMCGDAPRMGPVIENIVEITLRAHGLVPSYGTVRGREMDFAFPGETLGVEVKYQGKIIPSDAAALSGFKHALLVTRNTMSDLENAIAIPAYLFCLA